MWADVQRSYVDQLSRCTLEPDSADERELYNAEVRRRNVERAWVKLRSIRLKIERAQGFDASAPVLEQYHAYRCHCLENVQVRRARAAEGGGDLAISESLQEWEAAASNMWEAQGTRPGRRPAQRRDSFRRRGTKRIQRTPRRRRKQPKPSMSPWITYPAISALVIFAAIMLILNIVEDTTPPPPKVSLTTH